MGLKEVSVGIFKLLALNDKLLDLLEIPVKDMKNEKKKRGMEDIRSQIQETRQPYIYTESDKSILCVYPTTSIKQFNSVIEKCFIQVDIYVHKKKDLQDRRTLLIADEVIKSLNNQKVFDYKIKYYNKIPNYYIDNREFSKYGLVFYYNSIIF